MTESPGPWRLAARRLRHDWAALAAGAVLLLVVLAVFAGAPLASRLLGHGPNDINPAAVGFEHPHVVGFWSRVPDPLQPEVTTVYVLGSDGLLGRDELLRVLYGGQVSLEIAFGATLLALGIGTLVGIVSGFFGGVTDNVLSRLTELVMALPLVLVLIVLGVGPLGDRLVGLTLAGLFEPGVVSLALLIGAFTWYYPARLVRAHVTSLRHREFIEAATMIGASDWRILRSHVLPHLAAPLLTLGAIVFGANIVLEAGVSFIGAGIRIPTASWGSMLGSIWGSFLVDATSPARLRLTLIPSAAIFVTVLALNQLADGLREAFGAEGGR